MASDVIYRTYEPRDWDEAQHPRDESGRFTEVGGGDSGIEFVSPNVEHAGLKEAESQLKGERQQNLRAASAEIDKQLGIDSKDSDIIGAWADGAENSIMSISQHASLDQLRVSGAMKGYLADQKSVLLFHDREDAPAVLYKFEVPSPDLPKVHENLLADGLAFHTIVPHAGGMSIYVADLDGSLHDAVAKASGRYGANVEYRWGDAQFIGTSKETGSDRDQRDDARRAYAKIIAESTVPHGQAVWQGIHNRWGETLTPQQRAWHARAKRPKTEIELWPEEDQDRDDFLDYCIGELTPCLGADRADEVCSAKWEASGKLGKKGFVARADLGDDLRIEPCGKSCLACNEAPKLKFAPDFRNGVFVRAHVSHDTADAIHAWAQTLKLPDGATLVDPDEYHATLIYSKTPFDYASDNEKATYPTSDATNKRLEVLGKDDDKVLTLRFDSPTLAKRFEALKAQGGVSDFPEYKPHITIAKDVPADHDASQHKVFGGIIVFTAESAEPIDPNRTKDWDESKHPRGKTTPESTGGSFAPGEGGEGKEPSEAKPVKLNPEIVNVGGDEWNKRTAVRLEESYQRVKPELEKLALESVGAETKPKKPEWDELSAHQQDAAYAAWKAEEKESFKTDVEAAEFWDGLSDADKAKIAASYGIGTEDEEDEEPAYVPESWDDMSNADQEAAENKWMSDNEDEWKQSEADSYYSEYAPADARKQIEGEFNKSAKRDEIDWVKDALEESQDPDTEGPKWPEDLPFTDKQILDAIHLDYHGEGGSWPMPDKPEFDWDDDYLDNLKKIPGQAELPGIEPKHGNELLTEDMRMKIMEVLGQAFDKEGDDRAGNMDVPDWMYDNIGESMSMVWGEMSDKQKFKYVQDHTNILEEHEKALEAIAPPPGLPTEYDPLNKTTGTDYKLTQRLAQYMSTERAMQVFEQRKIRPEISGLKVGSDAWKVALRHHLAKADRVLWGAWKGSSTTDDGVLLQYATADELGGRLYTGHMRRGGAEITRGEVERRADSAWYDIGGYDGVKAYVRAKWETTQYLLDKAGINTLNLYRGYSLRDQGKFDKLYDGSRRVFTYELRHYAARERVPSDKYGVKVDFQWLPTLDVQRNGAVSTTTDDTVANGWKQGTATGVVLRAQMPRTAALSVPAYGINEHSEHEVVAAGTAWKGWDVWAGKAPRFEDVPLMQPKAAA